MEKQAKKWVSPDLSLRDDAQRRLIKIIGRWKDLKQKYADSIQQAILPEETVEEVVSECVRFGLFEEARLAAMFRKRPGLKTTEVDAVLKALLLKFTPYCPSGMPEASYDRFTLRSYPPFVELLQAVSDDFRAFVKKECL